MAGLMSKVAFASKVSILMKTTADDPNPTPGYLYGEVNKITYESAEYCEHMVEFLLERLKKKSLHVKLKVLLVIRNAVEKGSSDFARNLRKHSEPIKELKTFSGPPDPLLGDSLYVSIRKTSGEVLDVLFDTDRTNITMCKLIISRPWNKRVLSALDGFYMQFLSCPSARQKMHVETVDKNGKKKASSSVSQPNVAPKMEGFGVSTNTEEDNGMIGSLFGKIKEAVPTIKNAAASMMAAPETDNKEYQSYGNNSRPSGPPSNTLWGFGTTTGSGNQNDFSSSINPPPSSKNEPMNWLAKKNPDVSLPQPEKYKIDMHENEKRLVEEIVIPQGIRNQPTTQDMYNFCQKCKNLDNSVIMKLLSEKLTNQDSRVQLRTMHIIENLLQNKLPNITEFANEHCSSQLKTLQSSSLSSVRDKSSKLLQLMNKDNTDFVGSFAPPPPSNQSGGSLLDFNSQQNNDVFAGLQVQEKTTSQQDFDLFGSSTSSVQPPTNKPAAFGGPPAMQQPSLNNNDTSGLMNSQPKSNLLDLGLDPFASLSSPSPASIGGPSPAPNGGMKSTSGPTNQGNNDIFGGLCNEPPKKTNPVGTINYDLNSSLIFNEPIIKTPQKEAAPIISFQSTANVSNNFIADFSNMNTNTNATASSKVSDDLFGNMTGFSVPPPQQPQFSASSSISSISPSNNAPSSSNSSSNLFDGLQMNKGAPGSGTTQPKLTPSPSNINTLTPSNMNSFSNLSNFSSSNVNNNNTKTSSLDSLQSFLTPSPAAPTPSPSMNSLQKQPSFSSTSSSNTQQSNFSHFNQSNFSQQQQGMNQNWGQPQNMSMNRPSAQMSMGNTQMSMGNTQMSMGNTQMSMGNTQMSMGGNYQNFNQPMRAPMNFQQMHGNRFPSGQPYGNSPQQYGSPTMYGQSPQNSFNFMAPQRPTKSNNDSFSFVQDAMKASKR